MLDWDDLSGQHRPPVAAPERHTHTPLHAGVGLQERDGFLAAAASETRWEPEAMHAEAVLAPVRAEDKRVINGMADINQLAPFRYPWAWKYFLNANKNHWTPLDINMAQDIQDYRHRLTAAERHVYENVLAYLTTSDILAMRNIGLAVMEKMSAPELQIYQARQVYRGGPAYLDLSALY